MEHNVLTSTVFILITQQHCLLSMRVSLTGQDVAGELLEGDASFELYQETDHLT